MARYSAAPLPLACAALLLGLTGPAMARPVADEAPPAVLNALLELLIFHRISIKIMK